MRVDNFGSTEEKVLADGSDHNVSIQLSIDNGVYPLIDAKIDPRSIKSNDPNCKVKEPLPPFFTTDQNGYIDITIETQSTGNPPKECQISWTKSPTSIYLEYFNQ